MQFESAKKASPERLTEVVRNIEEKNKHFANRGKYGAEKGANALL